MPGPSPGSSGGGSTAATASGSGWNAITTDRTPFQECGGRVNTGADQGMLHGSLIGTSSSSSHAP